MGSYARHSWPHSQLIARDSWKKILTTERSKSFRGKARQSNMDWVWAGIFVDDNPDLSCSLLHHGAGDIWSVCTNSIRSCGIRVTWRTHWRSHISDSGCDYRSYKGIPSGKSWWQDFARQAASPPVRPYTPDPYCNWRRFDSWNCVDLFDERSERDIHPSYISTYGDSVRHWPSRDRGSVFFSIGDPNPGGDSHR